MAQPHYPQRSGSGGSVAEPSRCECSWGKSRPAKKRLRKYANFQMVLQMLRIDDFGGQALLFRYPHFWISRSQKDLKIRLSVWFKKQRFRVEFCDDSSPTGFCCNVVNFV